MKLATLCYLKKDDKTLMVLRNKKPGDIHVGKWNGLGGKFEPGETPEECAHREILEESGLNAEKMELRGILTFPKFAKGEDWYVFAFTVTQFSGKLQPCPEGELAWIQDDELLERELWEGDRIFLPWLNQNNFFSGKFFYESGKLTAYDATFYGENSFF